MAKVRIQVARCKIRLAKLNVLKCRQTQKTRHKKIEGTLAVKPLCPL